MQSATISFDKYHESYPEALYRTSEVAATVPDLASVDATAVADYRDRGFLAVRSGLDPDAVPTALEALAAAALPGSGAGVQYEGWAEGQVEHAAPERRLDMVRKFMRFTSVSPELDAIAHDDDILAVVERLLGGEAHMFQDMALLKPPGAGREKPWHQDNAFFHMVPGTPIVGVWIALDEATADNGCMRVIPGSHREGPARHAHLRDLQICDGDVGVPRAVAVPLPPGGLLLFDGLLQHGTPANHTSTRRRALQFHYTVADVQQTTDEQHRETFGWVDGAEC